MYTLKINDQCKSAVYISQALLLSVRRADLYTCIYKRSEGSLSVLAK